MTQKKPAIVLLQTLAQSTTTEQSVGAKTSGHLQGFDIGRKDGDGNSFAGGVRVGQLR